MSNDYYDWSTPAPTPQCVHCAGTIYNHEAGCPVRPSVAFPHGMGETVRHIERRVEEVLHAPALPRGTCPECGAMAGGHEQSCRHFDAWMRAMPHFDVCHRCGSSYQVGLPHDCRRATTRCMQHWNYSLDKWVDDAIIEPAGTFTPGECLEIRAAIDALRKRVAALELELSAKKGELE